MKAGINLYSIRSLIQTEAELVSSLHKLRAAGYSYVQYSGAEFDLIKGVWVRETAGIPIPAKSAPAKKASGVFARLLAAGERLMRIIQKNRDCANKDIKKFTAEVNALCEKWDL